MHKKRIIAEAIDFLITCTLQAVLFTLFIIKPLLEMEVYVDFNVVFGRNLIITFCSLLFLIIRDVLGKKSIGKIIMKLKIINKNDGSETGFLKRFIRNLTWLLGPIDIIVFSITKERTGDKIVSVKS